MKVLLDENMPHDLRPLLQGHDVFTVAYMGWSGVSNGRLLATAADAGFDVILTGDSGMTYEQNRNSLPLSVLVVRGKRMKLDALKPRVPEILRALSTIQPKSVLILGSA